MSDFDGQALTEALRRVGEVAEKEAGPCDEAAAFPTAVLDALRDTGLLGLAVPTAHGGMGGGVDQVLDAGIALGRVDMSVAMIFTMHCQQVAALVRHASPRLAEELLPQIAAGRLYLASVTTEAGKGGHLLTATSELTAEPGRLVIDRFAPIVTGGAHADGFLITMLSPTARSPHEVSLVFAHRDQLDIEVSGDWDPLGMRASHSVAMRLTGQVPEHQVIGEHGQFRKIVLDTFGPLAHLGWAASWLGTASGALSRVLRLLRSPAGRKSTNLDSELLLTRLSTARQRLDTVHALLRHTAATLARAAEEGDDLSRPKYQMLINALKITASEECHRTIEDLVDAVGLRHGYLKGSPTGLERALRDLRSAALNYNNDRLHLADGRLALLDPEVNLA
ncbi:acyl-CoA dehydrogenase family protein [Streptomyces sp. NPDC051555]|uniref:acyl-CoA dehydrogenase family protein n=1 Tax=Streptomyces sp. NPDC051555 TaxID=3365657 RepID=UPI0037AFDAD4